jgi:transcription initiation factor TFIID subunit 9B
MVQRLLRSMGVEDFEPRVTNMLLDLMYRYVTDVLQDAEVFSSEHLARPAGYVDTSGLMLAVQSRAAFNFAQPPTQELVTEIAQLLNAQPLEDVPVDRPGLALPPDAKQMTASNYQYEPVQP